MKPDGPNQEPQLPLAERIAYLIAGYLRGTLTEAEHDELDAWVVASEENTRLFEDLTDENNVEAAMYWHQNLNKEKARRKIKEELGLRKARPFFYRFGPYAIAACLVIAVGIYLVKSWNARQQSAAPSTPQQPGNIQSIQDRAVLTLASGRTIILDTTGSGLPASENGATIRHGSGAQIIYQSAAPSELHHTLSIPRGGQYQVVLSDGTRIWLNAASSLRFPAGFNGSERQVELSGEGYFEVTSDQQKPFVVSLPSTGGARIKATGTRFNIRAYSDGSATSATLLEGAVEVRQSNDTHLLKPGQQALFGSNISIVDADPEKEIAWRKKIFYFDNDPIETIAAEISRWYDVDIEYRGKITYHLTAELERNQPLESLLKKLEATKKVHFELDGRKLVVKP